MSEYAIHREGPRARVALPEKLTATEVPELQVALKAEIAAGVTEVIIDMSATTLIDSMGIGLLIATSNSLVASQGRIQLDSVVPDIFNLLRSMRLVERLHVTAVGKGSSHG